MNPGWDWQIFEFFFFLAWWTLVEIDKFLNLFFVVMGTPLSRNFHFFFWLDEPWLRLTDIRTFLIRYELTLLKRYVKKRRAKKFFYLRKVTSTRIPLFPWYINLRLFSFFLQFFSSLNIIIIVIVTNTGMYWSCHFCETQCTWLMFWDPKFLCNNFLFGYLVNMYCGVAKMRSWSLDCKFWGNEKSEMTVTLLGFWGCGNKTCYHFHWKHKRFKRFIFWKYLKSLTSQEISRDFK